MSTFPQTDYHSWSCSTSILEGATFHKMRYCKFLLRQSLQGNRDILPLGLLPLGLRVLDDFRSFCCMKEFGDGFDGVTFPRLLISWRKLHLSPFTHCPLVSHCQQSPRILCTRIQCLFCPLILDHGVPFIISISGAQIHISQILLDSFFPIVLNL